MCVVIGCFISVLKRRCRFKDTCIEKLDIMKDRHLFGREEEHEVKKDLDLKVMEIPSQVLWICASKMASTNSSSKLSVELMSLANTREKGSVVSNE